MTIDGRTPLPEAITDRINRNVKRLVAWRSISESDQEDLEQAITYELLRRRPLVSEARAQDEAFLNTVIKHAIADFFAARKADIRNFQREKGSLDGWKKTASGKWLAHGDTIAEEDVDRRLGRSGMSQKQLDDCRSDLHDAVAILPAALRRIVDLLMEMGTVQAVANALGLHRSCIYDALKQVKQFFAEAGLEIYLPDSEDSTRQIPAPAGW